MRCLFLFAATLVAFTGAARAQLLQPLSFSGGFNADIVVGVGETTPGFNADFGHGNAYRFFENGLTGSPTGYGLPASGTFISSQNSDVKFALGPYSGNNVALITDPSSITFTLTNPGAYKAISFLDTSNNGAAFTITLNFSDSTTATAVNTFDGDVYSGQAGVLANIGSETNSGFYTGPTALYEQDYTLAPADAAKTLTSFTVTGTYSTTYFFAASAEAVPEPSTYLMTLVGLASFGFLLRRKLA